MLELHHPRPLYALSVASLKEEFDRVRELHFLLQHEISLLAEGKADDLLALSEQRTKLTQSLHAVAEQRMQGMRLSGTLTDAVALDRALDTSPERPRLRAAWTALRREYQNLAALNRDASTYVDRHLQYLQTRWNGLTQIAGDAELYGSSGTGSRQQIRASVYASA